MRRPRDLLKYFMLKDKRCKDGLKEDKKRRTKVGEKKERVRQSEGEA